MNSVYMNNIYFYQAGRFVKSFLRNATHAPHFRPLAALLSCRTEAEEPGAGLSFKALVIFNTIHGW